MQDDQDTTPYRLKFADGTVSVSFYEQAHVQLVAVAAAGGGAELAPTAAEGEPSAAPSPLPEPVPAAAAKPQPAARPPLAACPYEASVGGPGQHPAGALAPLIPRGTDLDGCVAVEVGAAGSEPPSRAAIAGLSGSIFAQLAAEEPQECRRLAATLGGGGSPSEHAEVGET